MFINTSKLLLDLKINPDEILNSLLKTASSFFITTKIVYYIIILLKCIFLLLFIHRLYYNVIDSYNMTLTIIYIILISLLFFAEYLCNNKMDIKKKEYIFELYLYFVYDLLPLIPYSDFISNKNYINQIFNEIITLIDYKLTQENKNHSLTYINTIIYVILILTLLATLVGSLPYLAELISNAALNPTDMKTRMDTINVELKKNAKIYLQALTVLLAILIIAYIYMIHNIYPSNTTSISLKTYNIFNDILYQHENYQKYNNSIYDYKQLIRYYSLLLNLYTKNSTSHLIIICMIICPIAIFIITIYQQFEIYEKLHKIIDILTTQSKDINLKPILQLVSIGGIVGLLLLMFISINNFCIIFNTQIITIKTLYTNYYTLYHFINELNKLSFMPQSQVLDKNIESNNNITLSNVTLKFNDRTIFDNLNFELMGNNHYLIVGASGSGKSTFFNIILQFIKPEGDIFFRNKHISNFQNNKYKYIAYMRQGIQQESLDLYSSIQSKYTIINEELYEYINNIIKNISDKRAYIRMGLLLYDVILNKETLMMIIMDEPFAGVNEKDSKELANIINTHIYPLLKEYNMTMINSDHSINTLKCLQPNNILYLGSLSDKTNENISILTIPQARNIHYICKNIPGIK